MHSSQLASVSNNFNVYGEKQLDNKGANNIKGETTYLGGSGILDKIMLSFFVILSFLSCYLAK